VIKKKIFNDPVYGFIEIPNQLCFELIEHPVFQRLRRIRQVGVAHYVYPGAQHTRFQHSLGALYLMQEAISVLRGKGQEITEEEATGSMVAILLHDIGHGPFSHSLEGVLIPSISHEEMSLLFMKKLNRLFGGALDPAIEIFTNRYPKKFLHALISGQLDMDRMDFLRRDSFFTGVVEGAINSDRIIKMLAVDQDDLVVEAKGIYSIERFLTARRLMYWQVYLHKTVVAAETILVKIVQRAKQLVALGDHSLFASPALSYFMNLDVVENEEEMLNHFALLDDDDIMVSVKTWADHKDPVLSRLCSNFYSRRLGRLMIRENPFSQEMCNSLINRVSDEYHLSPEDAAYFVYTGKLFNNAYNISSEGIRIQIRPGETQDILQVSDIENLAGLTKLVEKHYLCAPKEFLER